MAQTIGRSSPSSKGKAVLGLTAAGVQPTEIVRDALLYGATHRESWGPGLTTLIALADLLPVLDDPVASAGRPASFAVLGASDGPPGSRRGPSAPGIDCCSLGLPAGPFEASRWGC